MQQDPDTKMRWDVSAECKPATENGIDPSITESDLTAANLPVVLHTARNEFTITEAAGV